MSGPASGVVGSAIFSSYSGSRRDQRASRCKLITCYGGAELWAWSRCCGCLTGDEGSCSLGEAQQVVSQETSRDNAPAPAAATRTLPHLL